MVQIETDTVVQWLRNMHPNNSWFISFNFQYNGLYRWERYKTAMEFYEAAKHSLKNKAERAFHENLFAAMESGISALLIALPDQSYLDSKRHSAWHTRINKWGQLGNVDHIYVDLFNKLSQERGVARYSFEEFKLDSVKENHMSEMCRSFLEFVHRSLSEYHPSK